MDFQKLIGKIAIILERLNIPYAITGGYAVSIWGRLRATFDIDVVIELPKSKVHLLAQALKTISDINFIDEGMVMQAVERVDEFQFIDVGSGIKIDFWVLGSDLFSKAKIKRRKVQIIQSKKIYFLSPEDLILSKLLWSKESMSEQQLGDVASIIRIQKNLDIDYMKQWAKKHSTFKLLTKLLSQNQILT